MGAADMFGAAKSMSSGREAIRGSEVFSALKRAEGDKTLEEASDMAFRDRGDVTSNKLRQALKNSKPSLAAGKTFYFQTSRWVDTEIEKHTSAPAHKIKFGTEEYFNLIKQDARIAKWLALGRNVSFFLNGTIYEVVEE
jgi:hypothetical protein